MSILQVKNVSKSFGGVQANVDISVSVEQGSIVGLIGPNGSGKTTLFNSIVGSHPIDEGSIVFDNTEVSEMPVPSVAKLGLLRTFQQTRIYSKLNCIENMLISHKASDSGFIFAKIPADLTEKAETLLNFVGLYQKRKLRAGDLSFGQQKLLELAMALMNEPKMLLLDEPTAGVDIELRRSMWAFLTRINEQGTTIILTTHYLEEAENLCRNIAIIDEGDIIKHSPMRELLKTINTETIVLDLKQALTQAPEIEGYRLLLVNDTHIEVTLHQGQDINRVFAALSAASIEVISMRNKTNRLEELFVNLVTNNKTDLKGVSA